jgi:DNA-binding response OmpR family regulator
MTGIIHIVDDEPTVRLAYRVTLEAEGFEVVESAGAEEALAKFTTGHFDVALLDMRMPNKTGLELLAEMRERNILTPTVIITAYGDIPHAVEAIKLGAIDFLQKPLTPPQLRAVVVDLLARRSVANGIRDRQKRVAPSSGVPLPLLLARHAINCRDFSGARYLLKEAIAQGDRPHEAHHFLGVLQQMDGEYDEAKSSFERSLAFDADFAPALQSLRSLGASDLPETTEQHGRREGSITS